MVVRVAHVSDFHVTADRSFRLKGEDPRKNLAEVVNHIGSVSKPDVLLIGGDVSHDGSEESYDFVKGLFERLSQPTVATPGNHDDRERLGRIFALKPGSDLTATLADGGASLLLADSQIAGAEDGHLTNLPGQSEYAVDDLVILMMHHDLVQTDLGGRPGMRYPERELARVLSLNTPGLLLLTGHRHMATDVSIGTTRILGAPATSTQFAFAEGIPERSPGSQPGYRLITLESGMVISTEVVTAFTPRD